jgi:competence protein ComEA
MHESESGTWDGRQAQVSLTRAAAVIVAIVAAVAAAYVVYRAIDERSAPPIVIADAESTLPVVVDVRGAVAAPGVYELRPGARTKDAIAAAGGLADKADLSTVNLARRLRDGEVIVIAFVPDAGGSPAVVFAEGGAEGPDRDRPRININTASRAELDDLPGIGEVMASRIVEFRETHGPYRSVDDLIHVQGISAKTIEGFRDQVTTGP